METTSSFPWMLYIKFSQEKGDSTWLTALPIDEHGFLSLHNSIFRNAVSLRYNWALENTSSHCSCGHPFTVEHTLLCPTGGFPSIRQWGERHHSLTVARKCVITLPETFMRRIHVPFHLGNDACLDIAAHGWLLEKQIQKYILDLRVFNPWVWSNQQISLASVYKRHEQDKKRNYEKCVQEMEHSTLTPLVMSTTRVLGRATIYYILQRLASMLSEKRDAPYSETLRWIRCHLSFTLLQASIEEPDPLHSIQSLRGYMSLLTLSLLKVVHIEMLRCHLKQKRTLTTPISNEEKNMPTFRLDALVFLRATMKLISEHG